MGAWGAGILDNDNALDFVSVWDEFVAPCLNSGVWNPEQAWGFIRDFYFRKRFNVLDSQQNSEILALAALYKRQSLPLPVDLKAAAEKAANRELRKDALDEWSDPPTRKKELLEFLSGIEGQRRSLTKAELGNPDTAAEIEKLLPFTNRLERWAKIVSPPHDDEEFERLYPQFFDQLDRVLIAGMPQPRSGTDQESRLVQLRFMLMAFYVGWKARYSASEITALVEKAEATGGFFWISVEVGGDRDSD